MLLLIILIIILLLAVGTFWRIRRDRKARQLQIAQLRRWAAEHDALEPALQQWIQRLSAAEAEVLRSLLDGYCTSLNWELDWLFAPQIAKAPELKLVLEESVRSYARAILCSLQMEADIAAYQAYLLFEQKPNARKQRNLVEQLYQRVNAEALTPPTKRFWGKLSRKDVKPKDQVKAIQQAFERDPARAMAALKAVLVTDAAVTVEQVRQGLTAPAVLAPVGA